MESIMTRTETLNFRASMERSDVLSWCHDLLKHVCTHIII